MSYKILIVEDNLNLVEIYEIVFTQHKFNLQIAYDGREALKALEEFKPEVVLLDIMMPNVNGFDFLAAVRKTNNPVKIIVNSNLTQTEEIKAALALGADEYLRKSDYDPEELVTQVKKFMS
jgi:DNA-binding response OmpR family regulator